MIYKVIDNYLDKKICHQLIEEADKITIDQEKSKFHKNSKICVSNLRFGMILLKNWNQEIFFITVVNF